MSYKYILKKDIQVGDEVYDIEPKEDSPSTNPIKLRLVEITDNRLLFKRISGGEYYFENHETGLIGFSNIEGLGGFWILEK